MLLHVAAGLREAIIGEHLLAGGDVRHQPIEDHAPGFIFVEAEIQEVVQEASALRHAQGHGVVDAASERIGCVRSVGGFTAEERYEVARGRETHTHHLGILGEIDQFIDGPGVETGGTLDRHFV